jgi:hypothetical protein
MHDGILSSNGGKDNGFLKSPCPINEKSQKPNFEGFDHLPKREVFCFLSHLVLSTNISVSL